MTSIFKFLGREGVWGALIAIAGWLFYRLVKRSTLYKYERKRNKDLSQSNEKLVQSVEAQAQRQRNHEKTMDKINSRKLSADDFSKLLSTYADER